MKPARSTAFLTASLLACALLAGARGARADDPPQGGDDVQAKIEAKMREILRLMRENGKALLEAAQGGTTKPKGVDFVPPDPSMSEPPPPGGAGSGMDGGAGGSSEGGAGGEIRRRMDEIIEQSTRTGVAIPKELEELIRMIPRKKSNQPPQGGGQDDPSTRKQDGRKKPEDEKKDEQSDPKDPQRPDEKPKNGDKPPPEGEKGKPSDDDTPPWAAELPPESRKSALNADPEKVPPQYRELLIRYQKWLLERAGKARDGR